MLHSPTSGLDCCCRPVYLCMIYNSFNSEITKYRLRSSLVVDTSYLVLRICNYFYEIISTSGTASRL